MKTLNQEIRLVQLLPIQVIAETTNGSAVDTKVNNQFSFETALVNVEIGNLGDQEDTKVKIEESDSATFATGNTEAAGGEEFTVSADTSYTKQIKRTKRYLRAVVTIGDGDTPQAEVFVGGLLCNAEIPMPIV